MGLSKVYFCLGRCRAKHEGTTTLAWNAPPTNSRQQFPISTYKQTKTNTRLMALCPRLPRWAGTGKVKPIWILLKQETVSGSGISWAICKSAPRSRQITTPAPTTQFFTGRMPFLPPNQQRQSTENQILYTVHTERHKIQDIKFDTVAAHRAVQKKLGSETNLAPMSPVLFIMNWRVLELFWTTAPKETDSTSSPISRPWQEPVTTNSVCSSPAHSRWTCKQCNKTME